MEKREPSYTVGGNVNWYSHYGEQMVGWHHRLDRHEFEQALGAGEGQRSLVCCNSWGRRESDMTERLN